MSQTEQTSLCVPSNIRSLLEISYPNAKEQYMKYKNVASFLAFTLAAAAPVFADTFPGHAKGGSKYVTFSEGFTSQQNSQSGAAECNFLLGAPKENGLSISTIAGSSSSGLAASGDSVRIIDFKGNQGTSSDKDKGKGKDKGKQGGGAGGGNGTRGGNGGSGSVVYVSEPGSQLLLLIGLAGFGLVFYRRKILTTAV
jgi:hypothetical protein